MTTETTSRKAGIYVRISQDREGERWGVQAQEEDCRKLAERLGWQVIGVYEDNDVSAFNRRKPRKEWLRLQDDIASGRIDAIIAAHTDRLYRQVRELEDLIDFVNHHRVAIKTVMAGDLDLTTSAGRQVARHLGVAAQGESERQAERIRRQKQQAAEQGRRHGGSRAFGWDLIKDATGKVVDEVVNEDEAKIIREAADRLLLGASLRAVCRDLNERGVQTVSGKPWTSTTLKRMVLSPRVIGYRVYHGEGLGAQLAARDLGLGDPRSAEEDLERREAQDQSVLQQAVLPPQWWHPEVLAVRCWAGGSTNWGAEAVVRLHGTRTAAGA